MIGRKRWLELTKPLTLARRQGGSLDLSPQAGKGERMLPLHHRLGPHQPVEFRGRDGARRQSLLAQGGAVMVRGLGDRRGLS